MLTLQALCIERNNRTGRYIWIYAQEPSYPEKGAKPDCVIQLICREVHTHAIIKQPEHGRTSTTDEQRQSSFQTNYDKQLITPRVLQMGVSQ